MTTELSETERHVLINRLGDLDDALNQAIDDGRDSSFIDSLHEQAMAIRRKLLDS